MIDFDFERQAVSRRQVLRVACGAVALAARPLAAAGGAPDAPPSDPLVDTHMHVWADDAEAFPFDHPYQDAFDPPPLAGTQEMLLDEMDAFGVTHCVLVQVIYHGWDNRYVAHCVRQHPRRFRAQGLIDPEDRHVADKLAYWVAEQGLSGMRFSPIYYRGRDTWLNAPETHALWKKAEQLGAIFNYFIATEQLPRLEDMVRRFPGVQVVVDHLARVDLKAADPLPEFNKLLRLARYDNVWVKLSELSVLSPSGTFPFADTFPWVKRMYDAYGADRILWGTGFPGATRTANGRPTLAQELDLVRNRIAFFTAEDRAKILGRNAARLWGFEPA